MGHQVQSTVRDVVSTRAGGGAGGFGAGMSTPRLGGTPVAGLGSPAAGRAGLLTPGGPGTRGTAGGGTGRGGGGGLSSDVKAVSHVTGWMQ